MSKSIAFSYKSDQKFKTSFWKLALAQFSMYRMIFNLICTSLHMREIVKTISPKWSWDIYYFPRSKVEGNSIIVLRSLRGNSFHYLPNKRAVNICFKYRFCFEREIVKNNDRLKSCQSVYKIQILNAHEGVFKNYFPEVILRLYNISRDSKVEGNSIMYSKITEGK